MAHFPTGCMQRQLGYVPVCQTRDELCDINGSVKVCVRGVCAVDWDRTLAAWPEGLMISY